MSRNLKANQKKVRTKPKVATDKFPDKKVLDQIKSQGDSLMILGEDLQNGLNLQVQSVGAIAKTLQGKFAQGLRGMTDKLAVNVSVKTVIIIEPRKGE